MIQKPKDFVRERRVGDHKIVLPECPVKEKIAGYNLSQKDQRWTRTELPKDFNFTYTPEQKKEFITKEWDRRENGYWFYCNGNIEYITGIHYFYLNWWKLGTSYPIFVDADRDFFYFWNLVEKTTKCDGGVYITHRGEGKTAKSTCIMYEATSKRYNVQCGIQSKKEGDAKKIFNKVILSWKKMPPFFKPIDVGNSKPARVLDFSEPGTRTSKTQIKTNSIVLDSFLDYESSDIAAYDGQTLFRIYHDEIGKTVEVDVDERINTVRECLRAGFSKYGRGKILATTTVEEMEKKGGKNCRKVWDKSSVKGEKAFDANGFTKNGMFHLFKPADYGYIETIDGERFVDEYGYSLREKAKQFFMNRRANLEGAALNSEKRKYPLEEKDIWVSDTKKAGYNTTKIEAQLEWNKDKLGNLLRRGNFYWLDKRFGNVGWNDDPNGKFLRAWAPPPEQRNKWTYKHGKKCPANTETSCAGLDPYDQDTTVDGRASDAASYVFRKFDSLYPYDSGIFVCEYVGRPPQAEIMFEDILMQAIFYGHEILIEKNKNGCIMFFKRYGFENYLMKRPEETQTAYSRKTATDDDYGIAMSGREPRMDLFYATESYIMNKVGLIKEDGQEPYMGKCYFNTLLECWKEYNIDDEWTEFDPMIGAGLAILAARKYTPRERKHDPIQLFDYYSTSGMESKRIDIPEQPTNGETNPIQPKSYPDALLNFGDM